MKLQNYYTLLQVLPQASTEEIKKAYRKLAKVWHPDKNQSPTAAKVFQGIHEAYKTLTNPIKRKNYNLKYWKVFGKPTAQTTPKEKAETHFSADDILRRNCDRMMRKSSKKSAQVYQDWLNNFWASWEVTPST
jgi:DnaJ-class molecular chaperone